MEIFSKGMILEKYKGYPETMKFDLMEQQVLIIMNRENIEKYPLGASFEFRFELVYNTIFLLMKYGNCSWISAPYSPHLSADFEAETFKEGEGIALTVLQICNENGKIHDISLIGLTTDFSNLLYYAADLIFKKIPFNLEEHRNVIAAVYNKFKTDEELAEECAQECRCLIK